MDGKRTFDHATDHVRVSVAWDGLGAAGDIGGVAFTADTEFVYVACVDRNFNGIVEYQRVVPECAAESLLV